LKLTTDRYEASRGLFATAELFVITHLYLAPCRNDPVGIFLVIVVKGNSSDIEITANIWLLTVKILFGIFQIRRISSHTKQNKCDNSRPKWLVPIVSSNPSAVYCRLTSLKFSASPALLTITCSFFPVAWNSSTNLRTDSSDDRSSCNNNTRVIYADDCSALYIIIIIMITK